MKPLKFIIPFLALLVIACSPIQIVSDQQAGVSFTSGTTYQIEPLDSENNKAYLNDINSRRIEGAIVSELSKLGFEQSDSPDILVKYEVGLDVRKGYTTNSYGGYYGGYGRGYGWGMGPTYSTTSEYEYKDGQLVISFIDAGEDLLLWYGGSTKSLDGDTRNRDQIIADVVSRIVATVPLTEVQQTDDMAD